jgi:hypothetical protein
MSAAPSALKMTANDREGRRQGGYYRLPPLKDPGSPHRSPRSNSHTSSGVSPAFMPGNPDIFRQLDQNLEFRETESVGKGFLYGKIRRSKIQRKPDP